MATLTKQALFSNAVMAYMAECTGGKLKKFCEVMTQEGGESITFNRVKASTGNGRLESMYSVDTQDGGDLKEVKVMIGYIGEQQKIKDEDMKKTKIDVKNVYVKSLTNGVLRAEDKKIIDAIVAKTPNASPTEGTNVNKVVITTDYTKTESVKKVIKEIKRAQAKAGNTPDNYRGVALVMSANDWADLATSEYVLNQDYAVQYGGGTGAPDMFYGAEVVILPEYAELGQSTHKAYVIPSNTVCFGEWEGSTKGYAEFHPTDKMSWHLQVVKSMGVEIAETTAITQFANA